MTRVITIAREYGSGGTLIADELSKTLGWKLLGSELIAELAARAQVDPSEVARLDEKPRSLMSRLLRSYWQGNADTWTARPSAVLDADYIKHLTALVIREAAEIGQCIVVGRGGQCILKDRKDTFHVFVYGSTAEKAKRIRHLY